MTAARLKTYDMFKKLWVLQWKLSQAAKRNRRRKFGILYDKVWWMETLEEAWKKVRANRGAGGVDGETIEYIDKEYGVERFLKEIQTELAEKRYRPEKVKRVWIDKPGRKERRPLGIPTVKDRVIQMAVKFIIEPILEVDFRECSYGFRPGRSAQQAIDKVSKYLACGCQWVIDLDIKSCFDSIPHEELIALLRERITDKWIIRLIRRWLKAGILDGSRVYYTSIGTCQGAVLSPLLANLYLNQLDKMWEERGYANRYKEDAQLIRYADDLVVLCPKKETAERLFKEIETKLGQMKLRVKEEKTRIAHLKEGFDFLGFHFTSGYSSRKGREVVVKFPSAKALKSIKEKVKIQLRANRLGDNLKEIVEGVNAKIRGWGNYFLIGNSSRQFNRLNLYVTEQLRLFLRRRYQKKRIRGHRAFPNHYLYQNLGLFYLPGLMTSRARMLRTLC